MDGLGLVFSTQARAARVHPCDITHFTSLTPLNEVYFAPWPGQTVVHPRSGRCTPGRHRTFGSESHGTFRGRDMTGVQSAFEVGHPTTWTSDRSRVLPEVVHG